MKASFRRWLMMFGEAGVLIPIVLLVQYFFLRTCFHPPYFDTSENDFELFVELVAELSVASAIAISSIVGAFQTHRRILRIVFSLLAVPMVLFSLLLIAVLYWAVGYDFWRDGKVFAFVFLLGTLGAASICWILRFVFRARLRIS